MNRKETGTAGEMLAVRLLVRKGFRVLGTNVRSPFGEIDIVAEDRGTVVFVEVKSKRGRRRGLPEEMLTPWKRRRLTRLALVWLQRHRSLSCRARFDVVAIEWQDEGEPLIRHYRDAFPAEEGAGR
jgi:putative endonuclease